MNQQAEEAAALAEELHTKLYGKENTDVDDARNEDTDPALDSSNAVTDPVDDTPPEPSVEDYETKFKVLQGKYNAEVPRLSAELREKNDVVQDLQTQLVSKNKPAPVAKDLESTNLNPEAFAEYDPEVQDLVKAVTYLTDKVDSLTTENTNLKESVANVESTQSHTVQNDFITSLERAVPEWDTINKNPDFIQWLQEVEPISGSTRQQHLDNAAETLNANKAITIFEQFNDSVVSTPVVGNAERIAQQASPDSLQAAAPVSEQKRSYTRLEIKQFYKDVANGRWKGYEDEAKAVEADIFLAPTEGRIVG